MTQCVILCVDDEQMVLKSLESQLLHAFGNRFVIEMAESAEEAIELLDELDNEQYRTLVIISDWLMPEMKGDEFLAHVHKKFPHILNLMLTGQADEQAVARAKAEGNLYKLIDKPWDAKDLIETLKMALGS